MESITTQLREEAFTQLKKENGYRQVNAVDWIQGLWEKFTELRIKEFPRICEIARVQNLLKWEKLRQEDSKGRFTDSYGWSKDKTFKFDFEIPQELYLFMVNLVDKDFWEEGNRKIWRKFMNKICKGEDPIACLHWVKVIYGDPTPDRVI